MSDGLWINELPHKEELLWWQKAGLSQTASGYGCKLTTRYMVHYKGRWRRVYSSCYSNSGVLYILVRGERIHIYGSV